MCTNPKAPSIWRRVFIVAVLVTLVALVYGKVRSFEFLNFDDIEYVLHNPHVSAGLTPDNLRWALQSTYAAMWCPVTWWSHQLDATLFGASPAGPHTVNVLLHALNTLLLFLVAKRMTHRLWESALLAALFAVHPLQVESVAWIAERKGLLASAFGLGAVGAYLAYVRTEKRWRYGACALLFILSLSSKPTLITLPALLLLLDAWPLERLSRGHLAKRLLEKGPLLLIAALYAVVTVWVHRVSGDTHAAADWGARIGNALTSCAAYPVFRYSRVKTPFFFDFDSKVSPTFFPQLFESGWRLVGERQVELVQ